MNRLTRHHLLFSLLLFGLAVRLIFFLQIKDTDLIGVPLLDCQAYHEWAARLAAGDWGRGQTYWMGPLYPHFLAVLYLLFGVGSLGAQAVQLGLSLVNVWLVWRVATLAMATPESPAETPRPGIPLLAAGLYLFYGPPVFYAGFQLIATLATTLYLLIAWQVFLALARPSGQAWFILGLLVGLAGLARGNVLLLLVTLPLLFLNKEWRRPDIRPDIRVWRWSAALVLGGCLMLVAPTVRNLVMADDFVLLTSNGGLNLLIGQRTVGGGMFAPVMDEPQAEFDPSMEETLERELGRDLKGSEVSRILTHQAGDTFLKNWRDMPRHYLLKTYRFWSGYELPQVVSYDFWRPRFSSLQVLLVPFTLLSALGLLGLYWLPRPGRAVLTILIVTYFLSLLPFFPTSRYRQPIAPLLVIAAAAYLGAMLERGRLKAGRRAVWLVAGGLLILVLLPRWSALDPVEVAWQVHLNQASRAAKRGDLAGAVERSRLAEEIRPGLADTPFRVGGYLEELGQIDEALAALDLAQARAPNSRLIPYRRGRVLEDAGRDDEALAAYVRAAAMDSAWSYPLLRSGLILRRQDRREQALAAMENACRLSPGNARIRANLASLCAETERFDRARGLLQELTRDYPVYLPGWFNLALVELQTGRLPQARQALERAAALRGITELESLQIEQLKQALDRYQQGSP